LYKVIWIGFKDCCQYPKAWNKIENLLKAFNSWKESGLMHQLTLFMFCSLRLSKGVRKEAAPSKTWKSPSWRRRKKRWYVFLYLRPAFIIHSVNAVLRNSVTNITKIVTILLSNLQYFPFLCSSYCGLLDSQQNWDIPKTLLLPPKVNPQIEKKDCHKTELIVDLTPKNKFNPKKTFFTNDWH
jgi:hypothetical protein